ncbi:phage structural protein [Paenilisteria newyorkensis]|uniref:phage structural protein n=1 Tax=Listeria newyorkensis TaxID=1497681 RepID=UPI000669C754|nr:hypothetical protein [Listeria newyorkensis]KMT62654.1 hypothetical protein X559_0937 [Listeria newyorkensis]
MDAMQIYDALKVTTVVDSLTLFGFADGDMVSCSKDANNMEAKVDAQGTASAAVNNDNLGTVKIDLAATSPCNKKMIELANTRKQFAIRVINGTETIGGSRAFVEKLPDSGFGKGVGTRSYSIKVLDYSHKVN